MTRHMCLACGSYRTRLTRRVVRCRDCEIAYYLPATNGRTVED